MNNAGGGPNDMRGGRDDNIAYIRQMLGELRTVAELEECDMLSYLIEMAYLEAHDIQRGRSNGRR